MADSLIANRSLWAGRFDAQSVACAELGSQLYGRLLAVIAQDIGSGGRSWDLIANSSDLRFGEAGPLRLLGTAHLLALNGTAPQWAAMLPSCGGSPPEGDAELRAGWMALVDSHAQELTRGLGRQVQTNEVGRAAGLACALAQSGLGNCRLIEIGCSGALNLRVDRFGFRFGSSTLGDPDSQLILAPQIMNASEIGEKLSGSRLPEITERIGIDPYPIDVTTEEGRLTLMSFLWPDQSDRLERLDSAIEIARRTPVRLVATDDTPAALAEALDTPGARVVWHSIVWQYIPTSVRWSVTAAIEQAGERATDSAPVVWIRYEPDEWDRSRAAIWLRTWPGGSDRLVAHGDFHGRWLAPVATPSAWRLDAN